MTTQANKQRCAVCGGELQATTITHAKVCAACGEIWIDEEVMQQIDKLIESGVPVRKVETPVYDFPRAVAPAH